MNQEGGMVLSSLAAAILAGGKGERMAGEDKGLVLYQGVPMALLISQALLEVADKLVVNANRNIAHYARLGFDVRSDLAEHQGKGPLAGLLACLHWSTTSHLMISPCDTPCISSAAFAKLKQASLQQPDRIYYLRDMNRLHPLHAVLPVESAADALQAFFNQGKGYSVMAFYEYYGCQPILWDKPEELLNVNTPSALKGAL